MDSTFLAISSSLPVVVRGDDQAVDARALHAFLGNRDAFANWFRERTETYDFLENTDFWSFLANAKKGRPSKEYSITIEMAKQLCMVERNEKGKQARLYFIECERRAKAAPVAIDFSDTRTLQTMLLGHMEKVLALESQVVEKDQKLALQQPAVEFLDAVAASPETFTINQAAHQLGIGEKKLWGLLRDAGHIQLHNNNPTQKYRLQGLYDVELKTWTDEAGWAHSYQLTRVTTKGIIRLREMFAPRSLSAAKQAMLPGLGA